jgi:hypothetical protein
MKNEIRAIPISKNIGSLEEAAELKKAAPESIARFRGGFKMVNPEFLNL